MRNLIVFSAVLAFGVAAAAQAPVALTVEQLAQFPPGEGREATVRVCSGCHEPEIMTQQRLAPADWARVVDTMAGNGAQGTDADFDAITAYLSKAFPAE
ncbi:hypothetical protein GCM10007973_10960 [Polymorphobacter multimanifer]|uniref:Mono/diheme cytochrome c family protein n=1 Tax=Polymorphobacter multimanifer TaxID=1070431 RepID=A0A841L238_9SPHN|nr:cytochrome c [Polymorphobacter multimanifer]MBB6226500.1 mono/diheme cytochrome c family protein [Polymorphobacter multimanifer]GGI75825.1 hypothetical protein GCM10007973_10960 [Polymorphobacter multimanifer]